MVSEPASVRQVVSKVADNKFRVLIDQNLVGTYVIQDGKFVYVNEKFGELFGYDPAEIVGTMEPGELTSPKDREIVQENIQKRIHGQQQSMQYSFEAVKQDGNSFRAEVHGSRANFRNRPAVVGVILNKSYSSAAEQAIQYLAMELKANSGEEFFKELTGYLANALGADFVLIGERKNENKIRGLLYHHGEFEENIEYELTGTPCENVIRREQCLYPENVHRKFPEDSMLQDWDIEFYCGTPLTSSEGETIGLLSVLHETNNIESELCQKLLKIFAHRAENELERQKNQRTIRKLAYHDSLTNLPNRTRFYEDIENQMKSDTKFPEKLALLFIDLDGFKQINDIFGHRIGDAVLQEVSKRIEGLRANGTLYRWGGDEFTYILTNIEHPKEPEKVSQTILEQIEKPLDVEGKKFHLAGSIGIAIYPDHAMDIDSLISHSEIAMFKAKEKPGNTYQIYIEGTMENQRKQVTLKQDLQQALDNEEFILHYQPQFDFQTGEILGAEALIRWESKQMGQILSGAFIPLAEATGLIEPIGTWVIKKGCEVSKFWEDEYDLSLRISVNVAPRQFQNETLLNSIPDYIEQYEIPPERFEIEITENTLMTNMQQTVEILEELRDYGIRVALDDFGTGYSSLLYLSQFPLDTLKIDRTFTQLITRDSSQAEVIEILRTVASELDLNVIAEGIEEESQLKAMKTLGCDEGQGFLLGEPKEREHIKEWKNGSNIILALDR